MKKLGKLLNKKWVYLYLIPVLLFISGSLFALYHIFTYDTYYLNLPIIHLKESIIRIPSKTIKDGDIIRGEFKAYDNNLGAIALRIKNNHDETVPDNYKLYFKIKEKGSKKWYMENSYNGGQFKELELFPFGIALIPDSKDKSYIFEITTKGVSEKNALDVVVNQKIVSEYLFSRVQFKDSKTLLKFIAYKFLYIFNNLDGIFSSLIYFLPIYCYFYILYEKNKIILLKTFSYILLIYVIENYLKSPVIKLLNRILDGLYKIHLIDEKRILKNVPLLNILLFLSVISDILFVHKINNLLLLIIIVVWGISLYIYKLRIENNYLIAIFFLIFCFLLLLVNLDSFAEKSAIWAYLFLVLGSIHAMFTLRSENSRK